MLMLNNSFSSYIILATAECTAFVINKSSVIDNHRLSSCLNNDESYLDFWSQIYSQFVDKLYQDSLYQIW